RKLSALSAKVSSFGARSSIVVRRSARDFATDAWALPFSFDSRSDCSMKREEVWAVRSKVRRATAPSASTWAENSCEWGLSWEIWSTQASARCSSSCCFSAGRSGRTETACSSLICSTGSAGVISSAGVGGWSLSMSVSSWRSCGWMFWWSVGSAADGAAAASDVDDRVQVLVGEAGAEELGMHFEVAGDPADEVPFDPLHALGEHGQLRADALEVRERVAPGGPGEGAQEADRVLRRVDELRHIAAGDALEHRHLSGRGPQSLQRLGSYERIDPAQQRVDVLEHERGGRGAGGLRAQRRELVAGRGIGFEDPLEHLAGAGEDGGIEHVPLLDSADRAVHGDAGPAEREDPDPGRGREGEQRPAEARAKHDHHRRERGETAGDDRAAEAHQPGAVHGADGAAGRRADRPLERLLPRPPEVTPLRGRLPRQVTLAGRQRSAIGRRGTAWREG